MYTYRSQKNFLCPYLLSCEPTRRDRFFYPREMSYVIVVLHI